jgi:hypothetical protein
MQHGGRTVDGKRHDMKWNDESERDVSSRAKWLMSDMGAKPKVSEWNEGREREN